MRSLRYQVVVLVVTTLLSVSVCLPGSPIINHPEVTDECCKGAPAENTRRKRETNDEPLDLETTEIQQIDDPEWESYCTKLLEERSSQMEFVIQENCEALSCFADDTTKVLAVNITCKMNFPIESGCVVEASNHPDAQFPKCCPKVICPETNIQVIPKTPKGLSRQLEGSLKRQETEADSIESFSSSEEISEDRVASTDNIKSHMDNMKKLFGHLQTGSSVFDHLRLARPLPYYQFRINEQRLMKNVPTTMDINEKFENVQSLLDKTIYGKSEPKPNDNNGLSEIIDELKEGVHCLFHLKEMFHTLFCRKMVAFDKAAPEGEDGRTTSLKPKEAEVLTKSELEDLHAVFAGINETISWFGIEISEKQFICILDVVKNLFLYSTEKNDKYLRKFHDVYDSLLQEVLTEYQSIAVNDIIDKNDTSVDTSVNIVLKATEIVARWFGVTISDEQCKNLFQSFCLLRKMIIYKQIDILEAIFKNPEESFLNDMITNKYKLNDLRKKRDILIFEPFSDDERKEIIKKQRIESAKKYVRQQREKLEHEEFILKRMEGSVKEVLQDRFQSEHQPPHPTDSDIDHLWDLWKLVTIIEGVEDGNKDDGQIIVKSVRIEDQIIDKPNSQEDINYYKEIDDALTQREFFLKKLKASGFKVKEDLNPEIHVDEVSATYKPNSIVTSSKLEKRKKIE